jgi:ABC-type sugar transport system substrate-binding protein
VEKEMNPKAPKLFLAAMMVVLIVAACTPATAVVPAATPQVIQQTVVVAATQATVDYWKPEDVTAACGVDKCQPLATLPKKFSHPWKLSFVTANKGNPFHGAFSDGIKAAAKFYGVDFIEADAAGGPGNVFLDLANTLFLQKPDAIGVLGQGPDTFEPIGAAAQGKGVIFLPADSGKSEYSSYIYGIPDTIAGKTAGDLLAQGIQERMAADWKGKDLYFVEFTHSAIPACVNRTGGFRTEFAAKMSLAKDHLIMADIAGGQTAQDLMAAALTAHPTAVFGLTGCWDQLGIDPFNAAREAGRKDDVELVTMGGDKPPADLLVTKPKGYYGYVEWQPFAEGWGWAETALAILEGIKVKPYNPTHVTTQANIEQRYVELYGALPTPAPK